MDANSKRINKYIPVQIGAINHLLAGISGCIVVWPSIVIQTKIFLTIATSVIDMFFSIPHANSEFDAFLLFKQRREVIFIEGQHARTRAIPSKADAIVLIHDEGFPLAPARLVRFRHSLACRIRDGVSRLGRNVQNSFRPSRQGVGFSATRSSNVICTLPSEPKKKVRSVLVSEGIPCSWILFLLSSMV